MRGSYLCVLRVCVFLYGVTSRYGALFLSGVAVGKGRWRQHGVTGWMMWSMSCVCELGESQVCERSMCYVLRGTVVDGWVGVLWGVWGKGYKKMGVCLGISK